MKRRKRLIAITLILIVVVAGFIAVKRIDFGALTVRIIERLAHLDIDYVAIRGNILRGFQLQEYTIRFAEVDSIQGRSAEIKYRLSPLRFGLPSMFEINLLDPLVRLHAREKDAAAGGGRFNVPLLTLSLRINVKNGTVVYDDDEKRRIEGISGLIFIDFVGARIMANTMNLSFRNRAHHLEVQTADLNATIDQQGITIDPFSIKERGFTIQGRGTYNWGSQRATARILKAKAALDRFGLAGTTIELRGDVEFCNDTLRPMFTGTVRNLGIIDAFDFETNYLADTILANLFAGSLLGGTFSAQAQIPRRGDLRLEVSFRDLNVGRLLGDPDTFLITGNGGYHNNRFRGTLSSPTIQDLGFEDLFFAGVWRAGQVRLDSVILADTSATGARLSASGDLYPRFAIAGRVRNFPIERFTGFSPHALTGTLTGDVYGEGDLRTPDALKITAQVYCPRLRCGAFTAVGLYLDLVEAEPRLRWRSASCRWDTLSLSRFFLGSGTFAAAAPEFELATHRGTDSILVRGTIGDDLRGNIDLLHFRRHGVPVDNAAPIAFDLARKRLGEMSLEVFDGKLTGTITPLAVNVAGVSIDKLSRFLGMREPISGTVSGHVADRRVELNARDINFIGLRDGRVDLAGLFDNGLAIDSLMIADSGQSLRVSGLLSWKDSRLQARLNHVGAWIFPFLRSFMEAPKGYITGDVRFTGGWEKFAFAGDGVVTDVGFGIKLLGMEFDSARADVHFDGNRIAFSDIQGKIRTHGPTAFDPRTRLGGGGMIRLEPGFRVRNLAFDFSFNDASLQYPPIAYGIASGTFSLEMRNSVTSYNGNISVQEAIVPIDFGLQLDQGEAERKTDNWRMNLHVEGGRNIWLRNAETDIEFGGEIYIIKEQGPVTVSGSCQSVRGNFYWLNHTLAITEGRVTFIPADIIDPELDVWAEMNTRDRDPDTNEEIIIRLHCFGPISEPVFEFYSDPPYYSEQDIITYLTLNITWRELKSMQQREYVGSVLPRSLLAWLESDVSRRIRSYTGLDYFRLEAPLFEPDEKTKVTVGKYLSNQVFITYTYDITSYANEFNVEYFLDDKNEILVRKDETGEYRLEYQYRIRF